jgi:CHAT domain-containing protein
LEGNTTMNNIFKSILIFIFILFNIISKSYGQTLKDSTSFYFDQNKIDKAVITATKTKNYLELIERGSNYFGDGEYKIAIFLFQKSIEIGRNQISEEQKSINLNLIGLSYLQLNDYLKAIKYLKESLFIGSKFNEEEDNIRNYYLIGEAYLKINNFKQAIDNFQIGKKLNTKYSKEYFDISFSYCDAISRLNDYDISEKEYLKYITEIIKHKSNKSEEYLRATEGISLFFIKNDKYNFAEKYILLRIEAFKNFTNINFHELLNANLNLINIYKRQGKLIEAEEKIEKILKEIKNNNTVSDKDLGYILLQTASIKQDLGKYEQAEKILLNCLEFLTISNENEILLNAIYSNIGLTFLLKNDYKNAEKYLLKALDLDNRKNQFEKSPNLLVSLAILYRNNKQFELAENYLKEAIILQENDQSNNRRISLIHLSTIYDLQEKFDQEIKTLLISNNLFVQKLKEISAYQSNSELLSFLNRYGNERNYSLSFLLNHKNKSDELLMANINENYILKNFTLFNEIKLRKAISKSKNTILIQKYLDFKRNKFILNQKETSKINAQPKDYEKLKQETELIEKYLIINSREFFTEKSKNEITFHGIKKLLRENEIFIDLVDFHDWKNNKFDDKVYAAFIVSSNLNLPKFSYLFSQKEIEKLIISNSSEISVQEKKYQNNELFNLIFKSIINELKGGINTIYISPSGLTHQFNFAALPIEGNQVLGEKYKVHIISSPAEIIDFKAVKLEQKTNLELLLYGGINYDKTNVTSTKDTLKTQQTSEIIDLQTRSGINSFGYLMGSQKEVNAIQLKGSKNGFKASILEDRNATEESIKKLDGRASPFVLHLATHGFFFPDPVKENDLDKFGLEGKGKIYKASDDPMMRSGLLFSGANKYWGKANENISSEDGILTASEISNLDLSACQLVVLSACETGLGEIKGSEGVFGLQRAFKMAGVKNIIMSLWKVPDTQTAELFELFYEECFTGKTIHEAFHSAQAKMKLKYSPYYWAGFVLLE